MSFSDSEDGDIEIELDDASGEDGIDFEEEEGEDNGMNDEQDGEETVEEMQENLFYSAKSEDDNGEALESFRAVLEMDVDKSKWGYKSLKHIIRRCFAGQKYNEMYEAFEQFLAYEQAAVNAKKHENTINNLIFTICHSQVESKIKHNVFIRVLDFFRKKGNEKVWFDTKLKQCNVHFSDMDLGSLGAACFELRKWCQTFGKMKLELLHVIVYEINIATAQDDIKKLKDLYEEAVEIIRKGVVITDSNVVGTIRECGGKIFMREENWREAYSDLFLAFKAYDESGNKKRYNCLQFLIIVAMLRSSAEGVVIDPFHSQDVKPYARHEQIKIMTELIQTYERNDIGRFEKLLKDMKVKLDVAKDPFFAQFFNTLRRSIQAKVLLNRIKPYRRVGLDFLGKQVLADRNDVESLCAELILDGKIKASIDQIHGLLILESVNRNVSAMRRYNALVDWTEELKKIHRTVIEKVE